MKKRNKIITTLLLSILLFSSTLAVCGSDTVVAVNVENAEQLHNTTFGRDALIYIGNGLYYDSTTRIVYWWNGYMYASESSTAPSAYYAPNGFPYRYNPETNTFEEINIVELLNLEEE